MFAVKVERVFRGVLLVVPLYDTIRVEMLDLKSCFDNVTN